MTPEQPSNQTTPTAEVRNKHGLSIIWFVPLVALIIGGWLSYQTWSEKGPTITISFASAEGLEQDKTRIKYKNVDIGKVVSIKLNDDLSLVLVTVEMDRTAETYLTDSTLFWVVKARVTAKEVSGLGTLFSGAYIGMEPGKDGKPRKNFKGLEVAPVLTEGLPGKHFTLHAEDLGSVDIGTPVYYRKVQVGQVVSYEFDPASDILNIVVFVNAPYHDKVRRGTRFYNASGIDIGISADGLKVTTESFVSILLGGIAFETPPSLTANAPLTDNFDFDLYPDRESITQHDYSIKENYLLYFKDSVRGLNVGAPVEFGGIKVGQVLDISLTFDWDILDFNIPVLIQIEPERIAELNTTRATDVKLMDYFVERGLRAQLKSGNLLTGQLVVDLKVIPDAEPETLQRDSEYPTIPTIPMPLGELLASVGHILTKVEKMPLDEIGNDLKTLIETLDHNLQKTENLFDNVNQDILPEIVKSLQQFQTSISSIEQSYSGDSSVGREMRKTLTELGKAARSFRVLSDYLQRHPEALLRGKKDI